MSQPVVLIKQLEDRFLRKDPLPEFRSGDTVRVQVKIREGEKERLQAFEGVVIRRARGGVRSTFTVRKVSYGVGVERVFSENSPNVAGIEVLSRGKVRQARLYFLRGLRGKAARIKERAWDKSQQEEKKSAKKKRGSHRKAARVEAEAVVETPAVDRSKAKRKARKAAKVKAKTGAGDKAGSKE